MRPRLKSIAFTALVVLAAGLLQSCATLEQFVSALSNLKRLQFRLADVTDFSLLGISFGGKSSLLDFNALDGIKLVQGFSGKRLPAEFVINIEAVNPNDGTGGSPQTVSTLTGLESRLLIDDVPTVVGNIDKAIEIPGTGQSSIIPIRMSIDLYEFFANKGYEDLLNLALGLGGAKRDTARLALDAQPTVTTPFGPIVYPGRITIISKEFR
ncbi:MAG: hypothetical protein NTW38_10155 [Candidatus Aminicenantes bacterium]|nr:hypothetical protein [Candidatus Aminicenantes bacterium]